MECSGLQLRPGNTKSGVGASELIEQAFLGREYGEEKYLSADAAYCDQNVMRTCFRLGIKFTITANQATTGWENRIGEIEQWVPWEYSEEEKERAIKRNKPLPRVELGKVLWQPGWNEVLRIPVIVKRTWEEAPVGGLFSGEAGGGRWRYYGVVTNSNLFFQSLQSVMERHNQRGNAENFIREEKYGYDLKHFPCQKLLANHAYALIAMVAHNILRWMAVIQKPDKPHFSKKLRRRFIFIPGKIVSHARQIVLKVSKKAYEEVTRLKEAWQSTPCPAFDFG